MTKKGRRDETFAERVNREAREARGARVGGGSMPESHRILNDWVRRQAAANTGEVPGEFLGISEEERAED